MFLNSDPLPSDFRVSSFEEGLLQGFVALEAIEDGYQDYDEAIKEKLFPPDWENGIRLGRDTTFGSAIESRPLHTIFFSLKSKSNRACQSSAQESTSPEKQVHLKTC